MAPSASLTQQPSPLATWRRSSTPIRNVLSRLALAAPTAGFLLSMSMERDAWRVAALVGCGSAVLAIASAARRHEARESAASLARLRELARERFGPDQPFETALRMEGSKGAVDRSSWRDLLKAAALMVAVILLSDAVIPHRERSNDFFQVLVVISLIFVFAIRDRRRIVLLADDLVRAEHTWSELPAVLEMADERGENLDSRLADQGFKTPEMRAWLVTRLLLKRREEQDSALVGA